MAPKCFADSMELLPVFGGVVRSEADLGIRQRVWEWRTKRNDAGDHQSVIGRVGLLVNRPSRWRDCLLSSHPTSINLMISSPDPKTSDSLSLIAIR
jgi:hypothetical protein